VNLEAFLAVARDPADSGMLEDGGIENGRLFGLVVEPQTGRDFWSDLHRDSFLQPDVK